MAEVRVKKKPVLKKFLTPMGGFLNGGFYPPGSEFEYDVANCPDGKPHVDWVEVKGPVATAKAVAEGDVLAEDDEVVGA